jgi:hypothetical protein
MGSFPFWAWPMALMLSIYIITKKIFLEGIGERPGPSRVPPLNPSLLVLYCPCISKPYIVFVKIVYENDYFCWE